MSALDVIARNPEAVLIATALLVVVVLILAFYAWHFASLARALKKKAADGFRVCGRTTDPSAAAEGFALYLSKGGNPQDSEALKDMGLSVHGPIKMAPYSSTSG